MKRARKEVQVHPSEASETNENAKKHSKLAEDENDEIHKLAPSSSSKQHNESHHTIENSNTRVCPYLDTVKREMLDFDYEKKCSVSLSTVNVYCCLVCGKYFQGRTLSTHASKHSMELDHHVFINMQTGRIYCLPDDYEVLDSSLNDIKQNVLLTISVDDLPLLDKEESTILTLDMRTAIRGVMGMNTLHASDASNAVFQCLIHLPYLRNFLLNDALYTFDGKPASELFAQLGNLTKRVWNVRPWRSTVSPHDLLQEISIRSEGKFGVGVKCDPIDFYSWIINTLHRDLLADAKRRGVKKPSSSAISDLFQGLVTIYSEKLTSKRQISENEVSSSSMDIDEAKTSGDSNGNSNPNSNSAKTIKTTPFFHLQLDLPTVTLLKDEKSKTASLQVPIFTLLSKFDGNTAQFIQTSKESRNYKIQKLPRYLVFFVKRFTQNMYLVEKNKTIVNFPVDELDMTEYTEEKKDTKYSLSAYICHTGDTASGSCLARYFHKANNKWYSCQEGAVESMIAEDHFVAEAYMLFYERFEANVK
jgi:U4/U6.U5 tri-snRNP-associated protein 2